MFKTPRDLALLNRRLAHPLTSQNLPWMAAFLDVCEALQPNMAPVEENRPTWIEGLSKIRSCLASFSMDGYLRNLPIDPGTFNELESIATASWTGPVPTRRILHFMSMSPLRDIAERDLTSLDNIRKLEEVKPCLILAGSVIESILLDLLEQDLAATMKAAAAVKAKRIANSQWGSFDPKKFPEWDLHHMIAVCGPDGLDILADRTEKSAAGLRNYRNFVHPNVERTQVGQGPLLAAESQIAVGIMELVIEQVRNWAAKKSTTSTP